VSEVADTLLHLLDGNGTQLTQDAVQERAVTS